MSRRSAVFCRAAVGVAALLTITPAAARPPQRPPPGAKAARAGESPAERRLREGEVALKAGDLTAAERSFSEAYRVQGAQGALFGLGRLALAQGRAVAAQDFMRRFLAADGQAVTLEQRAEAERILAQPLPSGEVAILGEPGSLVRLDGRLVAQLPLPVPLLVAPGSHEVRLEVPVGRTATALAATLTVKAERNLEVRFEQESAAVMVSELPTVLLFVHSRGGPDEVLGRVQQAVQQAVIERLRSERLTAVPEQMPAGAECRSGAGDGSARPAPAPEGGPGTAPHDAPRCPLTLLAERAVAHAVVIEVEVLASSTSGDPGTASGRPGGQDFRATVSLLDAQVGEAAYKTERRCDGCTLEALAAQLAGASSDAAVQGRARRRGELEVVSDPPGAMVELSGRLVGPTPYRGVRFAGSYAAMLRHPGYQELTQPVLVEEGKPSKLSVKLEPALPPTALVPAMRAQRVWLAELAPRPRWRLALGGGLIAGGVLTAGFGAAALSANGACVAPAVPPAQQCEQRYATLPLGAGLFGAGAAVSLIGVILMAVPGPRRVFETTVTMQPCPPGGVSGAAAAADGASFCASRGGR